MQYTLFHCGTVIPDNEALMGRLNWQMQFIHPIYETLLMTAERENGKHKLTTFIFVFIPQQNIIACA